MSFKNESWESRFDKMGDEAEGVFEYVCEHELELGFTRYGLNRPPLKMASLPARIRYTPDYLMSAKLVEVQGFGRDQVFKLKVDKWGALHAWNTIHPVDLFAWDTTNGRWCFITLTALDNIMDCASLDSFDEGKPYFGFPGDLVFAQSHLFGEMADALAA